MRGQRAIDLAIARLAGAQYGIVTRAQLLGLGLSDDAVDRRVARGRLHIVHRGVYAVGHPVLKVEGRWIAAVLAAGAGAVLSHTSAAAAWDLRPVGSGVVHITVPGDGGRRRRAGLRIHRSVTLAPSDTTRYRAIPVTTPLRTVIDLAATLRGRSLEHVLDLAEQRGLVDFAELHQRTIPSALRAVLCRYTAGTTVTRSEMEERFLALCDDHGLPRPNVNVRIEGEEVDFVWPAARLIVEVDGYRYHRSPSQFETDRERDVKLAVAGWQVLRFTWAKITGRAPWVAAAISNRLAR
jgi:very-short-patch-repair endonuclease